jgi:hypothetical protein
MYQAATVMQAEEFQSRNYVRESFFGKHKISHPSLLQARRMKLRGECPGGTFRWRSQFALYVDYYAPAATLILGITLVDGDGDFATSPEDFEDLSPLASDDDQPPTMEAEQLSLETLVAEGPKGTFGMAQ